MAEVFCPDCRRPMVGPPEPDCRNPDHNKSAVLRDPLALAMIAAWLNVRVDQVPKNLRYHTCQATMDGWDRVAAAAVDMAAQHIRKQVGGPRGVLDDYLEALAESLHLALLPASRKDV